MPTSARLWLGCLNRTNQLSESFRKKYQVSRSLTNKTVRRAMLVTTQTIEASQSSEISTVRSVARPLSVEATTVNSSGTSTFAYKYRSTASKIRYDKKMRERCELFAVRLPQSQTVDNQHEPNPRQRTVEQRIHQKARQASIQNPQLPNNPTFSHF